jgi:hypothetical protein
MNLVPYSEDGAYIEGTSEEDLDDLAVLDSMTEYFLDRAINFLKDSQPKEVVYTLHALADELDSKDNALGDLIRYSLMLINCTNTQLNPCYDKLLTYCIIPKSATTKSSHFSFFVSNLSIEFKTKKMALTKRLPPMWGILVKKVFHLDQQLLRGKYFFRIVSNIRNPKDFLVAILDAIQYYLKLLHQSKIFSPEMLTS